MPKRVRLTPPMKMDEGARKWMYQYARRHCWRVCSWLDLDDLFQEGYDAYYEACRRYPTAYDRPHIMKLFMLVYKSRIERLAAQKRYQVDMPTDVPDHQWTAADNHMSTLVAQAPRSIQVILDILNTEKGRKRLRSVYRRRFDGTRGNSQ